MSLRLKQSGYPWARVPALKVALLFIIGLILQYLVNFTLWTLLGLFTLSVFLILTGITLARNIPHIRYFQLVGFLLLAIILGAFRLQVQAPDRDPVPFLEHFSDRPLEIIGTISEVKKQQGGRFSHVLETETFIYKNDSLNIGTGILFSHDHPLDAGSIIHGDFEIIPFPEHRFFQSFNYPEWLKSKGIFHRASLLSVEVVGRQTSGWMYYRSLASAFVKRYFSPKNQALALAVVFGDKGFLNPETRTLFADAGLSHILAVSGMHVGFLLLPFLPLIYLARVNQITAAGYAAFVGLLLYFYAGLTGFTPSVLRASIMMYLFVLAKLSFQPREPLNILGLSALIILMMRPEDLFSIGFQLSFLAVLVLIVVGRPLDRYLTDFVPISWQRGLINTLLITLIIQIAIWPVLAYYFRSVSFVGIITNLAAGLLTTVIVPFSFLVFGLSLLVPLPWWLSYVPDNFVGILNSVAEWSHNFGFLRMETGNMHWSMIGLWFSLLGLGSSLFYPKRRPLWLWASSVWVLIFAFSNWSIQTSETRIVMLDVGQGDAIHIRTPGQKHLLVDTGPSFRYFSEAKSTIIPYLEYEGIERLEGLLVTHWDNDHSGGVKDILTKYPQTPVYTSVLAKPYAFVPDTLIVRVQEGDYVEMDGLQFFFMHPGPRDQADKNDQSLVFRLDYGEHSILFTGDAEIPVERELTKRYSDLLDSDILKVGHHGSRTSSSESFLKAVTPELSLASMAWKSRFKHPHADVMARLNDYGPIYSTARHGSIFLTLTTDTFYVNTAR